MGMKLIVVAVVAVSAVQVSCLPLGGDYGSPQELEENFELRQALIGAIFNNTWNVYTIKKVFKPNTNKICIPTSYNISCSDNEECGDTISSFANSSEGLISYVWTKYDSSKMAGKFLYFFATYDFPVFGFDWAGACSIGTLNDDSLTDEFPVLHISLPSQPCSLNHYTLTETLEYITTLMPSFGQLDRIPTLFDDNPIGYAEHHDNLTAGFLEIRYINEAIKMKLKRVTILRGTNIVKKIKTYKPKLYYHFWSAVVVMTVFICVNLSTFVKKPQNLIITLGFLTTSFIGALTNTLYGNHLMFSSNAASKSVTFRIPLTVLFTGKNSCCYCCCFSKCTRILQICIMLIAFFFINLLLLYFVSAIPTIVLVYYLYPTRTLIRVPFIISALFYTIALGGYVLHLMERFFWLCHPGNYLKSGTHAAFDYTNDFLLEKKYYQELIVIALNRYYIFYLMGALLEFVFYVLFLGLYIYGELRVADLVFDKSSNLTDSDVRELLVLIPTIILIAGTWYGRGIFFDLKRDLNEMNDKLTEQEKIALLMMRQDQDIHTELLDLDDTDVPSCCELLAGTHKWRRKHDNYQSINDAVVPKATSDKEDIVLYEEIISENLHKYIVVKAVSQRPREASQSPDEAQQQAT